MSSLFQAFQLGHLRLKNRIISTSHAPAYAENGRPGERYQRYHEEKARGGLAMTMFGGASSISPDSPPSFGQIQVGDDGIIPFFQSFSKRIHAHDVALICQLSHAGRRTGASSGNWLPTIAPSAIREPAHGSMPQAMRVSDIQRVIEDYAKAALRCYQGGLDGCELLVSGHLIGQFWSALCNRRNDAYGGSLANRLRFGLQVLQAIRDKTPDNFIVSLRFPVNEFIEGGICEEQGLEIAKIYAQSGFLDCLNVSAGANWTKAGVAETVPSMAFASGRFVTLAGKVRKATGMPVLHAAGVADLATAEFAVSAGHVDLIGMTRAQMADPHMVNKHRAGNNADIRPCVGAGYCIDRIYRGGDALCVHNAATGRESWLPQQIRRSPAPWLNIVIIGAGPAGLEAAMICAKRGHKVTVLEAQNDAGGQILIASRLPWRRTLATITQWRYERCLQYNVHFCFNTLADAALIAELLPDVVIDASGGLPNFSSVEGAERHALSVWDAMSGESPLQGEIVVFDDTGGQSGPSVAELLAESAASVQFITPDRCLADEVGVTNHAIHLRNLYSLGVTIKPDLRLLSITQHGNRRRCTLLNEYSAQKEVLTVDHVVVEAGTLAQQTLFEELAAPSLNQGVTDLDTFVRAERQPALELLKQGKKGYILFRIGDANAARGIHAAVFDAARLCSRM